MLGWSYLIASESWHPCLRPTRSGGSWLLTSTALGPDFRQDEGLNGSYPLSASKQTSIQRSSRRSAISALDFRHAQLIMAVPSFYAILLSQGVLCLLFPGEDAVLILPIGHRDAQAIRASGCFNTQKSRLMCCELNHRAAHGVIPVSMLAQKACEDHGIIGGLRGFRKSVHACGHSSFISGVLEIGPVSDSTSNPHQQRFTHRGHPILAILTIGRRTCRAAQR